MAPHESMFRYSTPMSREGGGRGADVRLFGPFRLDVGEQRLGRGGEELKLRRKPFAILRFLTSTPLRLVTQEELVEAVWGKIAMSESLLRTHMSELRHVLGEGVIETVVGRGYRFLLEVEAEKVPTTLPKPIEARATTANLVGRDGEMGVLRQVFETVLDQKRQVLFVTGDPGIGKTALIDAFLAQIAAPQGALIATGSCVEQFGTGEAYLPVLAALGAACRASEAEPIVDVLGRHAPTWLAQMPGLVPDENLQALHLRIQGATQARMLRELAEAFDVLAAERPLVLVLEDMQWSDRSTMDLVAMLGSRREPARVLVVASCRQAELTKGDGLAKIIAELRAHKQAVTLHLETLSEAAGAEYLAQRFPDHRFPEALAGTIHRMTGGNPLFTVAVVDDLESLGMIRHVDGAWRLTGSVADVAGRRPDTVRQLIDIQIDRLNPNEQRILEAASLVGAQFAAGSAAHALELPADEVDTVCEGLAGEQRFLRFVTSEPWPDGTIQSRYDFVHALYRDAALARIPSATKRVWHRRVADGLEAAYGVTAGAVAADLAIHFGRGQLPAKAAHYHVVAGEQAARRHGHVEAVAHDELARGFLAKLPEGPERDALDLRVSLRHGWSLFQVDGRPDAALPSLERARDLGRRLDDKALLGEALIRLEAILLVRGDLREATDAAREVIPILHHVPDDATRTLGKQIEATAILFRGQLEEAYRLLEDLGVFRAVREMNAMEAARSSMLGFSMGAFASWLIGAPDRALAIVQRALQLALEAGDPFEHAAMLGEGAMLHAWRREPARAAELARRSLAVSESESFGMWQNRAELILRWAEVELAPAVLPERANELLSKPWEAGSVGRTMHALLYAAMAARLGHAERALEIITNTLATIERTDERWLEPELHRLRGEVLKARNDTAEAKRAIGVAVEIAGKQGSRSLELRATLSLQTLASRAERKQLRQNLARLVSGFSEGLDTPDLIEARAVLEA
jgi:DNA-binding winged helix-turn-helix (wHTH) protein/tetratricopeptide (TPR) repeat protein